MKLNTKKNNEINDKQEAKVITVKRAKEFEWGISFDMIVNDVTIYGCKIITNKEGEAFVAFPSKKGSDDKYYNYAYVKLTDEDTQNIVAQIEKM